MSTGFSDQPGSREPGLDHLIKALTADGYPHELAGRDAALTAFRAAGRKRRRAGFPVRARFPFRLSRAAQMGVSVRLGAVAAAFVAAIAGLTAAAYAKALPAPVQHIAYSVSAPLGLGIPDNQQSAPAPLPSPKPPSTHAAGVVTAPSTGSPSSATRCPCPDRSPHPAAKGSVLTFTVARTHLAANGFDSFSGKLTHDGSPEPGVRLLLLEHVAGEPGWRRAGSDVTGGQGRVRIGVAHLTRNATFRLTGPNGVAGPAIHVTVVPRVLLWRAAAKPGMDRLVAGIRFGDPGDTVELQELSAGTWKTLKSKQLNAAHRASFSEAAATAAGHYYRAALEATGAHGAAVSPAVWEPRVRAAIGARAIQSHPKPGPVVPPHGTRHRKTPYPGPVRPSPVQPSPVQPSPAQPSPAQPSPVQPSPVAPTPTAPGPIVPSPAVPRSTAG